MRARINNSWVVCLAGSSFFFFQFVQITMFNVLKPHLMSAYNADSATLSLISSLYFWGTVIFLIPAGVILDTFSTRKVMLWSASLSLLGILIFVMADSIFMVGVGRFLTGISGGPFCFLANMRLASRWFPENRLAFVTGVIVASAMLGGMVAQTPFNALVEAIGWHAALQVNFGVGLLICLLLYLFVYDYPNGKQQEYLEQLKFYAQHGYAKGFKYVVFTMQNWYCGFFTSLLNLPIMIFGALWGMMYLEQVFNLSSLQASLTCAALFFGMLLGSPAFGSLSDRMCKRKIPMLIGLVMCLCATVTVIEIESLGFESLLPLFFIIGFGSGAQSLGYPVIAESNPPALTGSALGLASTIVMGGGAVFQPLIGWLIELRWVPVLNQGIPVYPAELYTMVFWIMPICMIIAACMVWLMKETHPQRQDP